MFQYGIRFLEKLSVELEYCGNCTSIIKNKLNFKMASNADDQRWIRNAAFSVANVSVDQIWVNVEDSEFSKASRRLHDEYVRLSARSVKTPKSHTIGKDVGKSKVIANPFWRGHCAVWIEWILAIYASFVRNFRTTTNQKLLQLTASDQQPFTGNLGTEQHNGCKMYKRFTRKGIRDLKKKIESVSIKRIWEDDYIPNCNNTYQFQRIVGCSGGPRKAIEKHQRNMVTVLLNPGSSIISSRLPQRKIYSTSAHPKMATVDDNRNSNLQRGTKYLKNMTKREKLTAALNNWNYNEEYKILHLNQSVNVLQDVVPKPRWPHLTESDLQNTRLKSKLSFGHFWRKN